MKKTALFLLLSACLASCTKSNGNQYEVKMDRFTFEKVNEVIREKVMTSGEVEHGNLVSSVSSAFLNTPYKGNTLVGSADTNEILVADFNGVDCFTLIDYVEALTRAKDYKSFINKLVETRYAQGNVAYFSRKHFFTDWSAVAPYNATDVTRKISSDYVSVQKNLNAKADGGEYIPNLGIIPREINYIPGHAIDAAVLAKLKSGDYIGVHSKLPGLDVSHTGIIIKTAGKVWFRNASSLASNMKVVDSPFVEYMTSKPGFIVLRAD
ncbi:DUF1460 domain-containing protein [Erwinia tasmaniensis]|uniref:Uncharacterized protein n=1 Tax=Erwinia tasmaniensis (strain DSM 17950 / CFBP 7177 / CIP 109463 / NCPPB 4357 / Et1/99) TaxID=465817 RepID=B2VK07_ERWT9|nr:DUF1460 domain-containing protein [Erwinia tasmaniensis]CAO96807.1 Conserved hypothetical protein (DUF1460) [Erwinia tasmaniensis Et1/99]